MAYRVIWSPAALEDADEIGAYVARDSKHYAAAVVRRLRDTARTLRDFPLPWRPVPELENDTIREKFVYSYRLIYRVEGQVVTIAAIVHMRQSFETGVGLLRPPERR